MGTAQEYLGQTPEREEALTQLESLQERWTAFQRQVADNRRLADLAIRYFSLLEQVGDAGRAVRDVGFVVAAYGEL